MSSNEKPRRRSVLLSFQFLGPAMLGSLVMALVAAFAPMSAQVAVLGALVSILAGLFVSYLEQESVREKQRMDALKRLSVPMSNYIHTKLGEDRRIAIPTKICQRLGITAGDPLVLEEQDGSLRIFPSSHVLREVQAAFSAYRTEEENLVDELIAERRAEAVRENSRG